jgi:hypothetical protein
MWQRKKNCRKPERAFSWDFVPNDAGQPGLERCKAADRFLQKWQAARFSNYYGGVFSKLRRNVP